MRYLTIILAICLSPIFLLAFDSAPLEYSLEEYTLSADDDMACLYDITISKWDCMLAVAGSIPCGYKHYDVLYSSTQSGPFSVITTHDVSTFYFVPLDGYYKMKVTCGNVCHESNVLYFNNGCSPTCGFEIDAPFPEGSTINHCYYDDGYLQLNADSWYNGCGVATYKWITPSGTVTGKILNGNYGYGNYQLTITCHDSSCYYEKESIWFKVKEHCYTSQCHFDITQPYHSKDHCYEDDGDLWINGASWVSHCSSATYKWVTPIGNVHGSLLEGNYGYGTYTLKVMCNSHDCNSTIKEVSFILKKKCVEHCHFKLNSPLASSIKHCYDTEGIVWIDASSWVQGCHNVHYKWDTPQGFVNGAVLDGKYGYGKFTLKVTCHDAACYYETRSTSFILTDNCNHHKPYVIHCPDTKWVDCDEELWNLDNFGKPYYYHNYKKIWVYGDKVQRHMNDCNRGYITREWKMKDPHGYWHSCSQTIYVGENASGHVKVDWPKDHVEVNGCNPSIDPDDMPYGAQKPAYNNSGCAKLGHSYSDQEFYYSGTCKKVVRKWTVIDWCVYDGNKDRDKGKYVYYQTIKINNEDKPIVNLDYNVKTTTNNCKNVQVDLDDIEIDASSCGDRFNITNNSPFADKGKENASGIYPIGTTEFYYIVQYGCGYSKKYKQQIIVEDEGDLTIYCEGKLVMPLAGKDTDGDGVNDVGSAEIWAKDFNIKSSDNCGGELDFSFEADSLVMARTFTCAEIGISEINIYASDQRGNQTYCVVEIHIQNNGADIIDCEPAPDDAKEEEEEEEEEEDSTEDESEDDDDDNVDEEDNDNTEEEDTDTDSDGEDDLVSDDAVAKASGLVKTQYGLPIAEVNLNLYMNVIEGSGEQTFEVVDIKIDSFVGGSGALIYILAQDTIYHDVTLTESMVMQSSTSTNTDGAFTFTDMAMQETYMIEPTPDMMDGAKLDIADANRLYAHLSGADPITDPYALIAADVDQSGSVDLDDLDFLLAFINGESDDLAEIEMIYIDATYQFADELSPWSESYSTIRMIEASEIENHRADFIAVTLGDIVGSSDSDEDDDSLLETTMRTRQDQQALVRPNPFYTSTTITVDNPTTQMAVLSLYTIDGQRVHESSIRLAAGIESFKITEEMTPQTGVYIYTLALEENTLRGRILKIK